MIIHLSIFFYYHSGESKHEFDDNVQGNEKPDCSDVNTQEDADAHNATSPAFAATAAAIASANVTDGSCIGGFGEAKDSGGGNDSNNCNAVAALPMPPPPPIPKDEVQPAQPKESDNTLLSNSHLPYSAASYMQYDAATMMSHSHNYPYNYAAAHDYVSMYHNSQRIAAGSYSTTTATATAYNPYQGYSHYPYTTMYDGRSLASYPTSANYTQPMLPQHQPPLPPTHHVPGPVNASNPPLPTNYSSPAYPTPSAVSFNMSEKDIPSSQLQQQQQQHHQSNVQLSSTLSLSPPPSAPILGPHSVAAAVDEENAEKSVVGPDDFENRVANAAAAASEQCTDENVDSRPNLDDVHSEDGNR